MRYVPKNFSGASVQMFDTAQGERITTVPESLSTCRLRTFSAAGSLLIARPRGNALDGSSTRLNREFGARFVGNAAYAIEGLVAELGATFLCADLGLSHQPRVP